MKIYNPGAFWLLLLMIPLLLTYLFSFRQGRRTLRVLGGDWRAQALSNIYIVKVFFSMFFSLLMIACLVLALAGLVWGSRAVKENREGIDLVFAVDLSRSMLADDIEPNRLSRSLSLVNTLLTGLPNSRYALVAFKGEAVTLVPLTEDAAAVTSFLDYLNPATLSPKGTNLESALETAARAVEGESDRFRVVLLLTDGENLEGTVRSAESRYRDAGIALYAVGTGTAEPVRIPLENGEYIVDARGEPVRTALNEDLLISLTERIPESRYYRASDPAVSTVLLESLQNLAGEQGGRSIRYEETPRYRIFLLGALFFFMAGLLTRGIRWKSIF